MKSLKLFLQRFYYHIFFGYLFLAQDFNIFKLGYEELIVGVVVAVVVGAIFVVSFLSRKMEFGCLKNLGLLIF